MGVSIRPGHVLQRAVFRWVVCLVVAGMVVGMIPSVTAEARSEVSQSVSVTIGLDGGVQRLVEICLDDECETFFVPSGAANLSLALHYTAVERSRLPLLEIEGGTPDVCTIRGSSGSDIARPGAAIDASNALFRTSSSVQVFASGEPVTKVPKKGKPQRETTDAVSARICLLGSTP